MNPAQTGDALLDLVERSGLLSADQLSAYRTDSDDPLELARVLVRDRLLTPFQARQLLRGKWRGYFLTEKYKVLDELGAGGGGRVLLCEHLRLEKLVALKLLNASITSMPGTHERFLREARAAAAVEHPNIVRVTDFDQVGIVPFMVMEFVDGTNLHHLVAEHGPLHPVRAADCARQAAIGLEAARRAGLVHRDIKPANLILDRSGMVRLTDLGLARFFGNQTTKNQNLTDKFDSNSVLGTLDFIAPEQADNSSNVDIRADIYSLGYTLYYLLTGKMPFGDGSAAQKLMWHQLRHPDPISTFRNDVPPGLERVFRQMTEKRKEDRFQTPAEVADALAAFVTESPPPPPAEEMPRFRANTYRLGLSPPPGPDVLVTPPSPLAPPTPTALETASMPRPPVKPPQPPSGRGRLPASGSHVLGSLPDRSDEFSVGEPMIPPDLDEPATEVDYAAGAGRTGPNQAIVVGLVVVFLAVGVGLLAWRFTRPEPADPLKPPPGGFPTARNSGPVGDPDRGGRPAPRPDPEPKRVFPAIPGLTGQGSSLVEPLMQKWAEAYHKQNGRGVSYTQSNSVRGVEALLRGDVAFACTDVPLTDEKVQEAERAAGPVVHVPLALGAVVATYNLPELTEPLKFTGEQLASIYLGNIRRWNDDSLKATNPGVTLPARPIVVVHRKDSSGTTAIWTDFLSYSSEEWKKEVNPPLGTGTWVRFPVGVGVEGNVGVADAVKATAGAIGYVELGFARSHGLAFGWVRGRGDKFVEPNPRTVAEAADVYLRQKNRVPDDLRFSVTNVKGDRAYPICSTTCAVLFRKHPGADRAELVKFLRWAVSDAGQKETAGTNYAPLPRDLVPRIDAVLDTIDPKP